MKTILSLSTISLFTLIACSPKSANLSYQQPYVAQQTTRPQYDTPAAQQFNWVTEDGGQSQLDFNPKIDILFIVDNSDSMKTAEENLSKNINKFTGGIMRNRMVDYHLGVTSCWDSSKRFADAKANAVYQNGDLRYVKDSTGKIYNQRFLTRAIKSQSLQTSTINIGVESYAEGGPEKEEFFSPLAAAIEKNGHGATNEGFFRDDAQLVVVIITDADDSTIHIPGNDDSSAKTIDPQEMTRILTDFKPDHPEKISVYGVLVSAADPDSKKDYDLRRLYPKYHIECFDKNGALLKTGQCAIGFGPDRLQEFITDVNAAAGAGTPEQIQQKFIMSILSKDYGKELGQIGDDITAKVLAKTIVLHQRPHVDSATQQIMIRVRYGSPTDLAAGKGQVIPTGDKGWLYNPDDNSIHLSGSTSYNYVDGARFAIDLIPEALAQ